MHIVFSCLLSCIKVASHQESQTMVCPRFVLLNAAACLIAIEEDFFLGEALGIRLNYLLHFLRVFNVVMAWCMKCSCCALLYVVSCEKLHPLTFHSYSLVLCLNCVVSLFPLCCKKISIFCALQDLAGHHQWKSQRPVPELLGEREWVVVLRWLEIFFHSIP